MASRNPTHNDVAALLPKFDDPDSDIRYMIMADMQKLLLSGTGPWLAKDYATCCRVVDCLLKALDDQNGDVQSAALSCIGPLASRGPPEILCPMIDKFTSIKPVKSQDPSIPATATRTLIASFPRPLPGVPAAKPMLEAYGAISDVLIPRLLGRIVLPKPFGKTNLPPPPRGMLEFDEDSTTAAEGDAIDVLNELVRCFGPLLQEAEIQALAVRLGEIVASDLAVVGSAMRKKAVAGISQLSVYFTDSLLDHWVQTTAAQLQNDDIAPPKRRVLVLMVGQVARAIPRRLGAALPKLAPLVLGALTEEGLAQAQSQMSEDGVVDPMIIDMKEAALITLEDLLSSCVSEMVPYTEEAIAACILHLSFDPGMIDADDEMDGAEDDEDAEDAEEDADDEGFEEEDQLSDDEDTSWKVRRCAAKALHSLIATRSTDLIESGQLFSKIAPALIRRFNEREENVKLEVLATAALLVKKTRDNAPVEAIENGTDTRVDSMNTRKRRRGSSDASMYDPEPIRMMKPVAATSERQELSALGASMVSGVIKMLGQKSIATKQAATVLLREYVLYKHDGLNSDMEKVMSPIIETIRGKHLLAGSSTLTAGTSTFASVNSLRIETLSLLRAISDTHASNITNPFLPKLAEALVVAIGDPYFKVSCHAIRAAESVLESTITAPSTDQQKKIKAGLDVLLNEIIERARSPKSELEVRQDAIHAMAVCLAGSTAAAKLTSAEQRKAGLTILEDRLRNETTRLASLQAVKRTVSCMDQLDASDAAWLQKVATEIAQQLRKADPKVRGSSLLALRAVVSHAPVAQALSGASMREIQSNLLPLLGTHSATNPAVAMEILEHLIAQRPRELATPELHAALCALLLTPLGASALDALLSLVEAVGAAGVGDPLMQSFLQHVGVGGDPAVVGLAIGTLLVSGGDTIQLSVAELQQELHAARDDQRRCLALAIFGEIALRRGPAADIPPQTFLDRFASRSDQVSRVAAVALGRAAVGNVATYLPAILPLLKRPGDAQLLLLHSVKEMLQHADRMRGPLAQYSEEIWTSLLGFSESEDTRVTSAECAGRLAALEPKKYLPMLQDCLRNPQPPVRGIAIQALRFALPDADAALTAALRPSLVGMLATMLGDAELENRRLALATLNAAARGQPALILPHLAQLLPPVHRAAEIDPSLVREVQMGPFRHKVDDGLETRKSAYETLHALLDTAYARLAPDALFDRLLAGLADAHEIKMLCGLMLAKLIELDAPATARRLDALAQRFQATLATRLKENAVKQEVEKQAEAARDALRCTVRLRDRLPAAGGRGEGGAAPAPGQMGSAWRQYLEWVGREFEGGLAEAAAEVKQQD